jgi:uncharacterized repeat protein (TIGR03847 family)
MAVHEFAAPERFVAGTIGLPGERAFYLQAKQQARVVSVLLEKTQVLALADRVDELLDGLIGQGRTDIPATAPGALFDDDPLDTPIEEEFRVAALAIGWDDDSSQVLLEALSADPDESADPEVRAPDSLRVRLAPGYARAFVDRARRLVSAGRPPCPFCSLPLDPAGHVCPRANGYRR